MPAVMEMPLSQGHTALVDADNYQRLTDMGPWYAKPSGRTVYAAKNFRRDGKFITVRMHAVITGLAYVDHRNGNGLDNRRSNLRAATHRQNGRNRRLSLNNTSGFKGVGWHKNHRCWQARIHTDGRDRYLGLYETPDEAARAYDAAAAEFFGEFARLNFPKEKSA